MVNSQDLFSKYESTVKDNYSIVLNSLKGINANAFFDLVMITGLNKNQLAEDIFQISLKTINRYKEDKKKLNPRNSEMILKLIVLYKKGIEIFGLIDSFNNWLNKPSFGIGNKIPYQIMNTSTGVDLIIEELVRIEYGDLA